MEPIEYVRALRVWWWVIAATVVIGLTAAWVTTPASTTEYEATRTLIVEFGEFEDQSENALDRVAFRVTNGDVPRIAAEQLGVSDPTELASEVETSIDGTVSTLTIATVNRDVDAAEDVVTAFEGALLTSVDREDASNERQLEAEISELNTQIGGLDVDIDALAEGSSQRERLAADRDAKLDELNSAESELQLLDDDPPIAFEQITAAEPVVVSSGPGRIQRLGIAGLLGLLLGGGLALVFARFDPRIRTKEQAQRAFGLPVLAEIPVLPLRRRKLHEIVTVSDPESLAGQAYRSLRTSLILKPTPRPVTGRKKVRLALEDRLERDSSPPHTQVVVIASPGMGEGKTTTTANLAAAFGETGRRVLVLECDLRRPTIGSYLSVDEGPGLSDLLAQKRDEMRLDEFIRETSVPNVKVITAGRPVANPDEMLTRVTGVVGAARHHADVVLVDTAPLLATDDASVLVPMADDVVVVCRAGRTPVDAAERATEILTRFGAPVAGVTLVGATVLPTARSYYRADHRFWQQAQQRLRRVDRAPNTNGSERQAASQPRPPASPPTQSPEHTDER
jgi:capsular exopolysaccharide synthesis family protein